MANALHTIRIAAKKIQAKHGGSYQQALKKAGKQYREGRIGKRPKKKTATKSHKVGSHHHRSRMGTVPGTSLASSRASHKKLLTAELGWLLATQRTAKTKREKKALQPKINALTKEINALQ